MLTYFILFTLIKDPLSSLLKYDICLNFVLKSLKSEHMLWFIEKVFLEALVLPSLFFLWYHLLRTWQLSSGSEKARQPTWVVHNSVLIFAPALFSPVAFNLDTLKWTNLQYTLWFIYRSACVLQNKAFIHLDIFKMMTLTEFICAYFLWSHAVEITYGEAHY